MLAKAKWRVRWGIALLLPLTWITSLFLPIVWDTHRTSMPGWGVLLIGWMGVLVAQFGWFANVFFLAGALPLVLMSRPSLVLGGVVVALLAACTLDALSWHELYGDNGSIPIVHFGAGYYPWLSTMAGAIVASIVKLAMPTDVHVSTGC